MNVPLTFGIQGPSNLFLIKINSKKKVLFPDSKAEFGFPIILEYAGSFWNMGPLEFIFN